MANMVIANRIKEKIEELAADSNSIIVLKGIPLSIVDPSIGKVNLSDVVSNMLS